MADEGISLFLDAAPDAIIVVDDRGRITRANPLAERMFRYAPGELIGQPIEVLVPQRFRREHVADRTSYLSEPHTRAMGAGQALTGVRRDGTEFPVEISLSPLRVSGATQVISIVRDLTDRLKAEQSFRGFLEAAPDAVVVVDRDGWIRIANPLAESMFGYTRDELLGQPVEILVPQRYRGRHVGEREQYVAAPRTRPMGLGRELLGVRKNGSEFPIEISLSPIETQQERLFISIIRDITERREAELLRSFSSRLIAVQEDERKRIAREVHDELGQGLTALKLNVAALSQSLPESPSTKKAFERINELIDDNMHDVRRIAGELRPTAIDDFGLTTAIQLAAESFQSQAGIECEVSIRPEEIVAPSSVAIVIYRILQEALTNVARHAQATRVEVRVRQDERFIILEVRDNGRGVTEEELSRSDALGQIGMRERAALIGGEVRVEGVPGKGTIVTLRAPGGTE